MIDRNVFLVGITAVGKTTIGGHLAKLLEYNFVDSDREIERRAGADISWIFDIEGEHGFRDREQQVLTALTSGERIVLATGGGAVLREENRRRLRERGTVVHVRSTVGHIVARAKRDHRRPLLQGDDLTGRVLAMWRARAPLYEAAAHLEVHAGGRPSKQVAQQVRSALDAFSAGAAPAKARLEADGA